MIFRFMDGLLAIERSSGVQAAKRIGQQPSASKSPAGVVREPGASGSSTDTVSSSQKAQLVPLSDLPQGCQAIIHDIHLSASATEQVMLFGFMSGVEVVASYCAPGGDPRVYRLDGTEVALRRDTARHILVRPPVTQERA